MSIKIGNLGAIAYHLEQGCDNGDITREALALFLRGVADEMKQLTAELAECRAVIAKIDIVAPLADETCLEPGITLSEAVRRQLQEQPQ